MKNLLSFKFWFKLNPGPLLPIYTNFLLIICVFFFLFFVFIYTEKKKHKKGYNLNLLENISSFSFYNFFIGLLMYFFNYERIPFFTSRFWYIVWLIEIMTWLAFLVKQYKKILAKKNKYKKNKEYQKYIP